MPAPDRPRLVEDGTGRKKLKVSLPGGRYQLSLDDGGTNLLCDDIGYELRDTVPACIARVLVATGDAWFPHQRDYRSVVRDLPSSVSLTDVERDALTAYLRTIRVPKARIDVVRDVVRDTPLAVAPDDIDAEELPSVPDGIFDEGGDAAASGASASRGGDATGRERSTDRRDPDPLADAATTVEREADDASPTADLSAVPGVGTTRERSLLVAGIESVDELAASRPADLAEVAGISDEIATTIVEGARELIGDDASTATRLARQTTASEGEFDAALSQLAAAGVPPSAAEETLRRLYGPSVADIDGVDGRMAYFLFEAGYATPWEIARASVEELAAVDYLGPTTAERAKTEAEALVNGRN